ncbi:MAG: transposase [Pseudomonadales bacterium]|nr:transposase [Pseudomonadales bacterium]
MDTLDPLDLEHFFKLIPNEEAARLYFETKRWSGTPTCMTCGSTNVAECNNHRPLPYRCRDCRKHFSVRTGVAIGGSRTELQKWLQVVYLLTSLREGVASEQLAQAVGIDERTICTLAQCIHSFYLNGKNYEELRRTRRHGIIEPVAATFDEVVGRLVVERSPASPRIDEAADYEYERIKGILLAVFRSLLTVELRTWEEKLPDDLWQEFRSLTQWRDNLPNRPPWWNKLVAELLYESFDVGVARYLLAVKSRGKLSLQVADKSRRAKRLR